MTQITQKEVELAISKILKHGDIMKIAEKSGIGYSCLDQQLNPNDPRKSYIFGSLQIQTALDAVSAERGERLAQTVQKFRELARPKTEKNICATAAAGCLAKEVGEVVHARVAGKPLYEQLSELADVEGIVARMKQGILDEINLEKETANAPNLRIAS